MLRTLPILLLPLLLLTSRAQAWSGEEHLAIGKRAYMAACEALEPSITPSTEAALRFSLACGENEGARKDIALKYGHGTAILGDYIGSTDDLRDASEQRKLHQTIAFALEKAQDWSHFHPEVKRTYQELHEQALRRAKKSHKEKDLSHDSTARLFEEAFYLSALADHFLHDAYATGHMGFNRPGSTIANSRLAHNAGGNVGRTLQNACGDTWYGLGDGLLECMRKGDDCEKAKANPMPSAKELRVGYDQLIEGATVSVYGTLRAFVSGKAGPTDRTLSVCEREGDGLRLDAAASLLLPSRASIPEAIATIEQKHNGPTGGDATLESLSDFGAIYRVKSAVRLGSDLVFYHGDQHAWSGDSLRVTGTEALMWCGAIPCPVSVFASFGATFSNETSEVGRFFELGLDARLASFGPKLVSLYGLGGIRGVVPRGKESALRVGVGVGAEIFEYSARLVPQWMPRPFEEEWARFGLALEVGAILRVQGGGVVKTTPLAFGQ